MSAEQCNQASIEGQRFHARPSSERVGGSEKGRKVKGRNLAPHFERLLQGKETTEDRHKIMRDAYDARNGA